MINARAEVETRMTFEEDAVWMRLGKLFRDGVAGESIRQTGSHGDSPECVRLRNTGLSLYVVPHGSVTGSGTAVSSQHFS